jgi:hypothetical protein
MLEDALLNYGMAGIFIGYLIYHDRYVNAQIISALKEMTSSLIEVKCDVETLKKLNYGSRQKNRRTAKNS